MATYYSRARLKLCKNRRPGKKEICSKELRAGRDPERTELDLTAAAAAAGPTPEVVCRPKASIVANEESERVHTTLQEQVLNGLNPSVPPHRGQSTLN